MCDVASSANVDCGASVISVINVSRSNSVNFLYIVFYSVFAIVFVSSAFTV